MARLPRLYAEGFAQLAQARFAHHADTVVRQSFALQFADIGRWLRLALADTDTLLHGWVVTPSSLTLLATPGNETSLARSIQQVGRHLASRLHAGGVFEDHIKHAALIGEHGLALGERHGLVGEQPVVGGDGVLMAD